MVLKFPSDIPTPAPGTISIFRNANYAGIVYYMDSTGNNYPAQFNQSIYKINPISFKNYSNYTGEKLEELQYDGKQFLFALCCEPIQQIRRGGGGGISQSTVISLIQQFGGGNVESGSFTRLGSAASGTQTITTVNQAKLIFFTASTGGSLVGNLSSDGKSNITLNNCINIGKIGADKPTDILSFCISVWENNGVDGQEAVVTSMNSNNYVLTWTKRGIGVARDLGVQWIAITN